MTSKDPFIDDDVYAEFEAEQAKCNAKPRDDFSSFVSSQDEWPEPKPITSSLPSVAPLAPELLPDVIRDYFLDVADRQQAPLDFPAVAAVCGLAAIVGNMVRIRPKQQDDWEVVPNLWGQIISRPSAMKSPSMRSALGACLYASGRAARPMGIRSARGRHQL